LKVIKAIIIITAAPNYFGETLLLGMPFSLSFLLLTGANEECLGAFGAFTITKVPVSCQGRQYPMWTDMR